MYRNNFKQEARLLQKVHAMLHIIEHFAKSVEVTQVYSNLHS